MHFGRGKNKNKIDIKMEDFYKYYKKRSTNPVSRREFTKITQAFNKEVSKKIIYEAFEYTMPYRLGTIRGKQILMRVNSGKPIDKVYPIDFGATAKLWEEEYPDLTVEEVANLKDKPLVRHRNNHTDNYMCKWYWNKNTAIFKEKGIYCFEACRSNSREMSNAFSNRKLKINYFE